ncbi:probable helicase senataxin [Pseudophryne corroboree]|uniref:probable helicase senataxin n=1 Tax=Pseudophryne corroboree TaxID=495146 RepID=UPI003081CCA0
MSTCRWCTPGGSVTTQLLRSYAARELHSDELTHANEDLSYCMECVVEYHRVRDEAPQLHKALWKMETSRLVAQLEISMREEIDEDDELYLVEEDGEKQLFGYTGPNFESTVRVPLLEILKYPYLLLDKRVSELCVEALCKMEQVSNSFQLYEKLAGVYLLLVHPNESIRRWAILTARAQGKVDRDDYYELQQVFTCLFKVIELGLFENPDIYVNSELEEGKLILLPAHLYDTTNYKNYWLGICMLLTVLEEQAMDSLLLGPDKQNDFMQSILHVMEKQTEDESTNPFWPALQCFMLILDRLGSKVWGQLIDPIQAFQTIIASPSYNSEIEKIRESCQRPTKCEPDSDDEDLVSCSQIVYNFKTERVKKDTGRKSVVCYDYCPNMYEDMQSLSNILQSDIGQDMRVHNSTFLWFVPYVQSVMDLKDLGIAYIMEVIHHLYSEIKYVLNQRIYQVDKVAELFIRVLVSIIELHRNKKCLHFLWVSSHKWVEALVKCSLIPTKDAGCRSNTKITSTTSSLCSSPNSQTSSSVQIACIQCIRNLLREGFQLGQQATCKPYLDKLNLLMRGNILWNLELNKTEVQGLQTCLTQIIKSVKDRASTIPNSPLEQATTSKAQSVPFIKTERIDDDDDDWYGPSSGSPLPSPEIKLSSDRSLEELFHVKMEAPDKRNLEAGLVCMPSSVITPSVREASVQETEYLASVPKAECSSVLENFKSKRDLTGWQSKLSKVMSKSSNVRVRKSSGNESKSSCENNKTISILDQSDVHLKRERDSRLNAKPFGNDRDTDEEDTDDDLPLTEIKKKIVLSSPSLPDKLQVSEEFERLSLENNPKTKLLKREFQDARESKSSNDWAMHSETDDELPLSEVKKKLLVKTAKKRTLSDSQVDRDLDHLSLVAQAKTLNFDLSQEDKDSEEFCSIKRKVKGAVRSVFIDNSPDQIITISDDSSDEAQKASPNSIKVEKPETFQDAALASFVPKKEQIKTEPAFENCDEYNSQCFEFETEDDIYSAWEDPQLEEQKPVLQEDKCKNPDTNNANISDVDLNNFDQWGYDTDYICDDIIEKAAEDAERQFKQSTSSKVQTAAECSSNKSMDERLSSKLFNAKSSDESATKSAKTDSKRKVVNIPKVTSSIRPMTNVTKKLHDSGMHRKMPNAKINKNKSPLKAVPHVRKLGSPGKALPAVVPPKKLRKHPEPTTTAEELGFKKPPRKAFNLSQRSLDSLTHLRNHGKSAGFVEAKKSKTKPTSPKSLLVKGNKKLLACQEAQFYRQSRPKETEKKRKPSNQLENSARNVETSVKESERKTEGAASVKKKQGRNETNADVSRKREHGSHRSLKATKGSLQTSMTNASEATKEVGSNSSPRANEVQQSVLLQEDNVQSSTGAEYKQDRDDDDDDDGDLFLTQTDPLDMELCSQVESEISVGMLNNMNTFSMVDSYAPDVVPISKCKYIGCLESVTIPGDSCPKHTVPDNASDHQFARPGLPPSLQKPTKPSTTKVFSSGMTSRTASLTKDIENLPVVPKAKAQPAKTPVSRAAIPSHQNKTPVSHNTSSVLQPLINQNNVPLQPTLNNIPDTGKSPVAGSCLQQREQVWLTREVLRWTFEMFDNLSQFGPPNNLCQLPLLKVPLRFSCFDEYFNVFVPLMLLNTFESLAQEWAVKQRALNTHMYKLYLQNFCLDSQLNRGEFQVWIRDADLNFQRHPKEDDLVFLLTPESPSNLSGEEKEFQAPGVYHTGHVFRFTRSQRTESYEKEQYTMCDLCIHTYGNLSAYRNQQVQCIVIGSLITTQRQFKALLQMQRNPLFRPIIHPKPTDFLPRDITENELSLFPSLKEYNSDQRYAIEKAHAIVKQHPRLARICLIHGPPGTGKSKTIVGLLYRILMESKGGNVPIQNLNAKNKKNRVLVCAPSNAALDELMKKIILEFKDKCHDKKNTLGNCGDINLVRLGSEKTISSDVVRFSLDCQVNYKINRAQQDHSIHRHKEALDRQLDELSRQRAMERCNKQTCEELDQKIAKLSKERQLMANSLKELRRRPQEFQRNIILESHIICCTLSTSGGILLESAFRSLGQEPFSCVIVDEAGQSCEVENLIPLLFRCSKLVLVGDPEQLPSTVISNKAEGLGYGQSLMSRLCQNLEATGTKSPVMQLTTQYRMHPDICLFPSNYFYKRALKTDRMMEEVRCSSDWPFQPYMVFDVADGYEKKERESFSNPQEIKLVVALIKLIKSKKKEFCYRNIGIITPYRAQKKMIIEELSKAFGNEHNISEVDTVDGFQGRQKDCIIVTCVRANSGQGCIGFLASRQRLNVTITRAKFSLFILGSLRTLMENKDWNHLIQDANRRGAIIKTKEEHYQKDVNKILKLKPIPPRTPFMPHSKPVERYTEGFSHTLQTGPPARELNNPPRPTVSPAPQRLVAHPAVDIRNLPSSSAPVASRRLQDPRLARRQEPARGASAPHSALQQQQSDANQTQGHLHSSSLAGGRPPQQPSASLQRSHSDQGDGNRFSRHQDYRERRASDDSGHEVKKRKVL